MSTADESFKHDIETGNSEALAAAGVHLPPEPVLHGPLKPVAETTVKERLALVVAVGAVATSIVAIIVSEGFAIVLVAGILSMIMAPYAYYQQTKLTDIAILIETAESVQREVKRLKAENSRLSNNIDQLETTIEDLQDVEDALEVISKTQGQSVSALERQVQENKEILSKMKMSTKGRVIQNLITVIYRGDENDDEVISKEEADEVIKGLKHISGLKCHEKRLRKAIVGQSIESVIDVVKNLLSDDTPPDQRIFEVDED